MRQGCESGEVDLSKGGTLDEKLWNGDEEGGRCEKHAVRHLLARNVEGNGRNWPETELPGHF